MSARQDQTAMLWLSEGTTRRTFFGTQWAAFTGRSTDDETGEGWLESVHPDDEHALRTALEDSCADGGYLREYRLLHRDGIYRPVMEQAEARLDEQGNFLGFAGATNEVAPTGVAESAGPPAEPVSISQSDITRLGQLLDQSPIEIYVMDASSFRFVQVNQGAIQNLGYTQEELLQLPSFHLDPELSMEQLSALLEPLRSGTADEVTVIKGKHHRKDGTSYPIEAYISLAHNVRPPVFVCIAQDISERRALEAELEQAYREQEQTLQELEAERQRLEELVESIPGVVWETRGAPGTGEYRVTYLGPQVEDMLGYTADEVDDVHSVDALAIVHPDDRWRVTESLLSTFEDGKPRTMRFRWIAADGWTLWVQSYFSALRDADQRIIGLRGVILDITEQQRAEELLNFSIEVGRTVSSSIEYETTLQRLAELAVPRIADWCAVYLRDESGNLRQVSTAHVDPERMGWVEQIGKSRAYAPEDLSAIGPERVVATGESQLVPEITEELLQTLVPLEARRDACLELDLRSYMCVPMIQDGRTLGAISLAAAESGHRFDDLDLRAAQHLAQRAARAVSNALLYREARRERARFMAILSSVDYGVCQVSAQGELEHANPAAEALMGRTQAELHGVHFHDLVHGKLEDGEPCMGDGCPMASVMIDRERGRADTTFATGDGEFVPVEVHCSPIVIEGQVTGAVIAFEGITERLAAEQRKDDYLAFASHELKNPLTPILGLSRWFERNVRQAPERYEEEALEAAQTLVAEGNRMLNIVDVFLDLSRIEANRMLLDPAPLDLCEAIRMEVESARMRHAHVQIETRLPAQQCNAISDEGRLRQVLSNLLENAAKYGGERPHITVTLDAGELDATIRVRDDGPGIAEEDQAKLFERFFRSQSSHGKKGLGVGLFLTRQIVEQLGGRIGLNSRPGAGAEFAVTLPYRPVLPSMTAR